jgi:hypothetical protein
MMRSVLVVILAALMSGCAAMTGPGGLFYGQTQQMRLSRAVTLVEDGQTAPAEKLLAGICAEKGVPGVTDEALFRLSLLRLGAGPTSDGMLEARQNLERLRKEYPSSAWTPLGAQLARFLTATGEVQQQEAKLKELVLSLTKENRELHQRLDMLKKLELELGKTNH